MALAEAREGFGPDDPHVAAAAQNLAELYRVQKKYEQARPLYEQVSFFLRDKSSVLTCCVDTPGLQEASEEAQGEARR